jgi:hypothetical protein
MSNASDYLEDNIVKHLFRTGSYTKPSNLYVALYTAAPSDSGGGTEVTGGSYARVACNPSDSNWAATSGTNGVTSNVAAINFGTASASWGTITHFGILDASSGGNLLVWGALSASKTVGSGDAFQIPAGSLTVTVA